MNKIFSFFLFFLLLTSCSDQPIKPTSESQKTLPESQKLQNIIKSLQLVKDGELLKGIKLFERIINTVPPNKRAIHYLSLSETLFDNNHQKLSKNYLNKFDKSNLPLENQNNYKLMQAALNLTYSTPKKALALVNNTVDSEDINFSRRKLKLLIKIFNLLNQRIEEVQARIDLVALQIDTDKKTANEEKIWAILSTLPLNDLFIEQNTSNSDYQSWIEFVLLARKNVDKNTYAQSLQFWLYHNTRHPSLTFMSQIEDVIEKEKQPPKKIAIILPITGKYKAISEAIIEGIFVAQLQHTKEFPNQTTNFKIYNSGNEKKSIWPIFNKAQKDKPDIIIGPLQKNFVDQLHSSSNLTVPVLSLNYSNITRNGNDQYKLIEFGLHPEDEARQISEMAKRKGFTKTLAIVPRSTFGQRMLNSYKDSFESSGGKIISHKNYSRKQHDFSQIIIDSLNIDSSHHRYRKLKNITGEKFEFEPRIRRDVDNIFLVAHNKKAKQFLPQLKFFQIEKIPVLANSQVYDLKSKKNTDLNNLKFVATPWTLGSKNQTEKNIIKRNNLNKFKKQSKFYALGLDSFNILKSLSEMKRNPDYTYKGAIGKISLDSTGRLHHELEWASIQHGKIQAWTNEHKTANQ